MGFVELLEGYKRIGCKQVFKTTRDSHDNIECYKVRLLAKDFTQKDDIDYKETFLPFSKKDSFRIILTLVANYDLELHQIDVKIAFSECEFRRRCFIWTKHWGSLKKKMNT